MSLGKVYRVAAILVALMLALATWGLAQVGPDARVPIHWSVSGEPDDFAPALWAFLMGPALVLGMVALLTVVPRIEPRRVNLERSGAAYRTVAVAILIVLAALHVVVVLAGTGRDVPVGAIVAAAVGITFAVIGNVLGTVRSNLLFGVRTPWTLSSERSWDRTHRLVGRLLVLGGLGMALLSLTGEMAVAFAAMIVFLVTVVVVAVVYSYRQWKEDPDRRALGGRS